MDPELLNRVLDCAVRIQQIPAPTFAEHTRAKYIQEQFTAEGLCDIGMDELGNVYARLTGNGRMPPLVVSAHLDTVFPASTNLQVTRQPDKVYGAGIGDNAAGVAGLFGLLWILRQREIRLPGDLWLVGTVGEEGLGNLGGMRAVVERFGDNGLAYLVLEGMALGQIYHRALGVQRYRITVRTAGGHSWVDHGHPSAVHEIAALITRLSALSLPSRPRTSLNVGVVVGGTTVNTIAAEAYLELDLRSEGARALTDLVDQVDTLVKAVHRPGVQVTSELIGQRPSGKIQSSHPLVRLAERCLQAQGIHAHLGIGSTDANVPLSLGYPAICLGMTSGGGAHTVSEYIHIAPLAQGLEQLVAVVQGAFMHLD